MRELDINKNIILEKLVDFTNVNSGSGFRSVETLGDFSKKSGFLLNMLNTNRFLAFLTGVSMTADKVLNITLLGSIVDESFYRV